MKSRINKQQLVTWGSAVLMLVMGYAAVTKAMDRPLFERTLAASPWLTALSAPLSIGIPLLEIGLGMGLWSHRYRQHALFGTMLLMTCFTGYVAAMLLWSPKLPCGCGGIIDTFSWRAHLLFNGVVTILALSTWSLQKNIQRTMAIPPGGTERTGPPAGQAEHL